MNIDHLILFIRIAATQNISAAGAELGLSPAVASAHLSKLEANLGVRLVHRTTRKVSLTEEGQAFFPHAEEVLASIEVAKASVGVGKKSPSGTLKVAAPASFGRMHLIPALKDFMREYPKLKIDLTLSDTITDLVEGGFDVAIRNSALKDSSLIARKLCDDRRILSASPEYLAYYGKPETPEDLKFHNCITLFGLDHWGFKHSSKERESVMTVKVSGNFRTDNGEAIRDACVMGLGITINSTWSIYRQLLRGELVEVLGHYPLVSNTAIWVVYPSARQLALKVRSFIDFFSEYFGDTPYWDEKNHTS
jgi:DNA-binding transcriptional LysR family regulator